MDSDKLSPDCWRELFDLIAAPLERQVFNDANKQIRSTKELLKMPDAKELLWVASDGNEDLQPNIVWYLLTRIIQKKKQNGEPLYSNIEGLVYFTPRMLVKIPNSDKPAQIWLSGPRRPHDQTMNACLNELSKAWPRYVAWAQRSAVEEIDGDTSAPPPQNIHFLGATPKMPSIVVNYGDQHTRAKRRSRESVNIHVIRSSSHYEFDPTARWIWKLASAARRFHCNGEVFISSGRIATRTKRWALIRKVPVSRLASAQLPDCASSAPKDKFTGTFWPPAHW
jgi:hypothetical protein